LLNPLAGPFAASGRAAFYISIKRNWNWWHVVMATKGKAPRGQHATDVAGFLRLFVRRSLRDPAKIFVKKLIAGIQPAKLLSTSSIVGRSQLHRTRGDLPKAERVVAWGRLIYPHDISLAIEFAEIAGDRKDQTEAVKRWRAVSTFGPKAPPRAWVALARLLRQSGELEAAKSVLQTGLSIHYRQPMLTKELVNLARDARWHPETMGSWVENSKHEASEAPKKHYLINRAESFIRSQRFRDNARFVQACAFGGMQLCHSKARAAIQWAEACRDDWANTEAAHELSWAERNHEEKANFIGTMFMSVVQNAIERVDQGRKLTLGLSSGYDSRALLYALCKASRSVQFFTFGQAGNSDYDFVSVLSRERSVPVRFFDTSEVEWNLSLLEGSIPHTQNYPVSPITLAAAYMSKLIPGRVELHGNLGDSLTGGPPLATIGHGWQESLPVFCRKSNFFAMQGLFPPAEIASFLPPEPFVSSSRLSYAKQLDFGYLDGQRMRPVNGPLVEYLTPFRNDRWVGFWLNRSAEEVQDRSLWITFLRSLNAPEFPELNCSRSANHAEARKEMMALLYGKDKTPGAIDLSKVGKALPGGRDMHFCVYACYENNASFRDMVHASIGRLRRRGIFENAFIEDVVKHFERKAPNADRMINGLVSLDLMTEAELFS
jgi:hypothetical protein